MQSSVAGPSYGQKNQFGMDKLLNHTRRFAVPTRRKASMPVTMTSTAMTNSNPTTNVASATSMGSSSSTMTATRVAVDAMMENVNTNTSMTANTTASTMASVKSMMKNSTRSSMANHTTASTMLASATAAAGYTSVNTTKATKPKHSSNEKPRSKSKRKYDDSEDEDDFEDDDDPPPPKNRNRSRLPKDDIVRIKKSVKAKLLQRLPLFKNELLKHWGFGPKQWAQLYDQMNDDDDYIREHNEYVYELFFSAQNKKWRNDQLSIARDVVDPNRLGQISLLGAIIEALKSMVRNLRESENGGGILLCLAECLLACLADVMEVSEMKMSDFFMSCLFVVVSHLLTHTRFDHPGL